MAKLSETRSRLWIADHRTAVRIVCVLVVLALAIYCVEGFLPGAERSGRIFPLFILVSWILLTSLFGWLIPNEVDRNRATQTESH
jgi:hypothetical protein